MKTGEQKQRYFALDRIRAIALLNMIAYYMGLGISIRIWLEMVSI